MLVSLAVRSQNQEAGNKRGREGLHLRVVEDCLRQLREKPSTNPNLRARGRAEDRTTTLGAWSGTDSNRVLGRAGQQKETPSPRNSHKGLRSSGDAARSPGRRCDAGARLVPRARGGMPFQMNINLVLFVCFV